MASLADAELPQTDDLHKYHTDRCESTIIGWVDSEGFKKQGKSMQASRSVLSLTKPASTLRRAGRLGDCGVIESSKVRFVVEGTTKIADCVIHQGKVAEGAFAAGEKVTAVVSKDRNAIKKNHTATHLLQWALQEVVRQISSTAGKPGRAGLSAVRFYIPKTFD